MNAGDIAREWSPLIGLVLLSWFLRTMVSAVYRRVKKRIDRKLPDNLPIGAGAWLVEAAREREMNLRVLVATTDDDDVDAFLPGARTVILSQEVHAKHDASFWAVAAHELGHARVYQSSIAVQALLVAARVAVSVCTQTATTLILANILYAMPLINRVAFTLLLVSLGAFAIVLVDEAAASSLAIRMLARDRRVDRGALFGATTALAAAFMTYVAGFVGQLVLVGERDFVVTKIETHRHFVAAPPASDARLAAAVVLSLVLALVAGREIAHDLRRPQVTTSEEVRRRRLASSGHTLLRGVAGLALVGLLWDQPLGPLFGMACVAAILASELPLALAAALARVLIAVAIVVPVLILGLVGIKALELYTMWNPESTILKTKDSALVIPKPQPSAAEIERTERAAEEMNVEMFNHPPWWRQVERTGYPAIHIAFAIGVWVAIALH